MIKICTIGGGSSYTPELIEGFIKRYDTFPVNEICLVDVEAGQEKLEIVSDFARRMIEKAGLDIKIINTLDRRAGIKDANFITTQFRVGQLEARILDERIPISHGCLGQETNGAGGLFKGLRTIPVILDIIEEVEELAPNAWVVNFANPAGMITEAVARFTNFRKFIGLCNVPYGVKMGVSKLIDKEYDDFEMTFAGLNHLVYGVSVKVDGKEVIEDVIERSDSIEQIVQNINEIPFELDFSKALNLILCPYHRYYYKSKQMLDEEIEEFKKNGHTRATLVKDVETELFELYKEESLNEKPKQLELRGGAHYSDAACSLIDSIYNDRRDVQVVNTMNNGALDCFADEEAVEISSVITKDGPVPLKIGSLPVAVTGLLRQIKSFEIISAEAAVKKSKNLAYLALCVNPLSQGDEVSKLIVDELFEAHSKYLEGFK